MIYSGTDKFGNFKTMTKNEGAFTCVCGEEPDVVLMYFGPIDLGDVKAKDTILKSDIEGHEPRLLGITCGCYAKLHRQVTHIQERMKSRASR